MQIRKENIVTLILTANYLWLISALYSFLLCAECASLDLTTKPSVFPTAIK